MNILQIFYQVVMENTNYKFKEKEFCSFMALGAKTIT